MIKITTFTDSRMTISASRMCESAIKFGADSYSIWTPNDLSIEFKETMKKELEVDKGYGLYCWKPYIVHREMCRLQDGDVLVYCDAGNEWVGDMKTATPGYDIPFMFFGNGWPNGDWCKGDMIKRMFRGVDEDRFIKGQQVQASTFFLRVCASTRKFVQEWYAWSISPGMIDNSDSLCFNKPTFREHRWDQSILSALIYQWNITLHWFPTTTARHLQANHPDDKYPVLLNHHRKRNNEY